MKEETLRMERVTYREQGVTQLENFSMTVRKGEIMGLVPVNHHGLAALIRLLQQNLPLHYGYVYYGGKRVNHWRYSSMSMNRISVIQSKSCLADDLTVAENIFVLRPGFRKWIIQPKVLQRQLQPFLQDIGMELAADACVNTLSPFERVVAELLKAVVAGQHLVVLKEISTFISDAELTKMHQILRHYAGQGMSFLYVEPHFEEVRQICGRTALMMNGQITKVFRTADGEQDQLFLSCTEDFDRHVREQIARRPENAAAGGLQSENSGEETAAFRAVGLCRGGMRDLDFQVAAGECLVLQDVDHCVLPELLPLLMGEARPGSGILEIGGSPFEGRGDRRLAVIQESPLQTMLFPNMSYLDNLCFTLDHRFPAVWRNGKIKNSLRQELAEQLGETVFDTRVEELTEQQKMDLIYMRVLLQSPQVVFAVQPFKSAEVTLRIHIWELLRRFLEKGIAVVILALNLADSLALADRVLRVRGGRRRKEYRKGDFASLPVTTPWQYLYREEQENAAKDRKSE